MTLKFSNFQDRHRDPFHGSFQIELWKKLFSHLGDWLLVSFSQEFQNCPPFNGALPLLGLELFASRRNPYNAFFLTLVISYRNFSYYSRFWIFSGSGRVDHESWKTQKSACHTREPVIIYLERELLFLFIDSSLFYLKGSGTSSYFGLVLAAQSHESPRYEILVTGKSHEWLPCLVGSRILVSRSKDI